MKINIKLRLYGDLFMDDITYKNNIEYLKENGWIYIGDRYTNGYCELWCSDLYHISGGILVNIVEDIINPLVDKIKKQEKIIEKQQKILKIYGLEKEISCNDY